MKVVTDISVREAMSSEDDENPCAVAWKILRRARYSVPMVLLRGAVDCECASLTIRATSRCELRLHVERLIYGLFSRKCSWGW